MTKHLIIVCILIIPIALPGATVLASPQIQLSPQSIGYPEYTKHGIGKPVTIQVVNAGDAELKVSHIGSAQISPTTPTWLAVSADSVRVQPGGIDTGYVTVTLNAGGHVNSPGTVVSLNGEVYFLSNAPSPDDSVSFKIQDFIVADTVVGLYYDTIAGCGTKLVVDNHGNMGAMGAGSVNMDFIGRGECDPNANVYLFDASPIVVRKTGTGSFVYTNGLFHAGIADSQAWRPLAGPSASHFSSPFYNGFFTGTMVNRDTSIGVNIRYYAPKGGGDTCNVIFEQLKVFKKTPGTLDSVTIGQVIDWNVLSMVGPSSNYNTSGFGSVTWIPKFVWQRGADTAGATACSADSNRYAAQVGLGSYSRSDSLAGCMSNTSTYGTYVQYTDSSNKYDGLDETTEGGWYWSEMHNNSGLNTKGGLRDMLMVTTFRDKTNLSQDTLTCWLMLTTSRTGQVQLENNVAAARRWFHNYLRPLYGDCCIGGAGNVDCSYGDEVDVGDLTALVDHLFITFTPICCEAEANCDGDPSGNVDIVDLTALIDNLFITFTPLPYCGGC